MLQDHQGHLEKRRRHLPEVPSPAAITVRDFPPQLTTEAVLDRFDLPFLLRKHKFKLLAAPLICGLSSFLLFSLQTPLYESSATLLVDPNFDRVVQVERIDTQAAAGMESLKSLEIAVIADSIILRVIKDLNLRDEPGFLPRSLAAKPNLSDAEILKFLKENRLTAALLPETRLIQISVLDPLPERAQRIAAALSTEFEAFLLQQRTEKIARARQQIEAQANAKRQSALKLEEKLRQFRLDHPGFLVEQDHNLFSQRLTEIGTELNRVRQDRSLHEGREKALRELDPKTSALDIVEVAGYKDLEHVSALLSALSASRAKLGAVAQGYRENHTLFLAAQAEVASNEQLLATLAKGIKTAVSANLKSLRQREELLQTELNGAMDQLGQVKSLSSEFRAVQQQSEKEWTAHAALQQKLTESEVASVWSSQIATLVASPLLPYEKAKPQTALAAAAGGLGGCLLSGAALLFLLVRGAPVSNRLQLEQQFQPAQLIGEYSPRDQFHELRNSSGLASFLSHRYETVLVSSLGKPDSAACIAQQMAAVTAKHGRSTLYLKIWNQEGDPNVKKIGPSLYQLAVNSSHVKDVARFPVNLAQLKRDFDQVFIEADQTEDEQLIAFIGRSCDHKVLAVQSGHSRKEEIKNRLEKLSQRNRQSVSLILISPR